VCAFSTKNCGGICHFHVAPMQVKIAAMLNDRSPLALNSYNQGYTNHHLRFLYRLISPTAVLWWVLFLL
jgi:hypothetical protein